MFWGVMPLELPGNAPGLGRLERFVERRALMRVEIVQHHTNHLGFGVADVHQPLHFMSKVHLGALLRHLHVPPASLRFDTEEEIPGTIAFVLVIKALGLSGLRWQRDTGRFDQLLACFINIDLRTSRIIRLRIDLQDVFHGGDTLGTDLWDTPLLLQPRLEVTFFQTRRTLSYEYASARPRATTRSASRCKVQRLRPSGAALQASAIRRASACASSLGCVP